VTSLSLYEDLLGPRETLDLPHGPRIVYVASGELAGLHSGRGAYGRDEARLAAGADGATVLRWELTEWSVDDAKLCASVHLDPWAEYLLRCERGGGDRPLRRAHGPGIGCVLRGELAVDGETVTPFGAWVEPADLHGRGSLVRVVLVRPEERSQEDALQDSIAQGAVHL
jgi:hypothetical protein